MTAERTTRRAGGRADRVAKRAAPPENNPCPPGQRGGFYKPLSESDIVAIYETALRLLGELGMGEVPEVLERKFLAADAVKVGSRVRFPREMVERCIGLAAKTFTFHGRDPSRSIEVGGDRVHFGTGGAAVQTLDLDTGRYRPSTLTDLYDFTRLQDYGKQLRTEVGVGGDARSFPVRWVCVPTDCPRARRGRMRSR